MKSCNTYGSTSAAGAQLQCDPSQCHLPINSATALKGQVWLVELLFRKEGLILKRNSKRSCQLSFFCCKSHFASKCYTESTSCCGGAKTVRYVRNSDGSHARLAAPCFATVCFASGGVCLFTARRHATRHSSGRSVLWPAQSKEVHWEIRIHRLTGTQSERWLMT